MDGRSLSDSLVRELYDQLRALARRQVEPGATLQPTVLVHEVWLRLTRASKLELRSRAHFMALAAQMMRQILIDHARRRGALRRGGGLKRISISGVGQWPHDVEILALEAALVGLERIDARDANIVKMRFFAGMSMAEIAEVIEVSERTVQKRWRHARAWLLARLSEP